MIENVAMAIDQLCEEITQLFKSSPGEDKGDILKKWLDIIINRNMNDPVGCKTLLENLKDTLRDAYKEAGISFPLDENSK